jgi:hypothetical protein
VIILTPGNIADCTVAPACVGMMAGVEKFCFRYPEDADVFCQRFEGELLPLTPR